MGEKGQGRRREEEREGGTALHSEAAPEAVISLRYQLMHGANVERLTPT